ncbi:MAG: DMT family transporter [Deltaproteobacteria bacterium]|nr:DMT family transporter [Deltaproteobacteria bacterium]
MLGEAMALACALCWASAVWLFRRAGAVDAKALNIYKNVIASALLLALMAATGRSFDWQRSTGDWAALVVSAALGLSLGDTLFFLGLQRVGTSVAAVTDCTYAPTVAVLSQLILGEALQGGVLLGAPLVVAGLGLLSWQRPTPGAPPVDRTGVALCVAGVMVTATAVVVAKPALGRSDLIEATTVRLIAGTAILVVWDGFAGRLHHTAALLRPQPLWRWILPATIIGTFISMLLWMGGFKYTAEATRAALLNQMGTVFALIFAAISGDVIPGRRWAGAALAFAGAVTVLVVR